MIWKSIFEFMTESTGISCVNMIIFYTRLKIKKLSLKMPKARKLPSIEQGVFDAISILKDAGIEEALQKYSRKKIIT